MTIDIAYGGLIHGYLDVSSSVCLLLFQQRSPLTATFYTIEAEILIIVITAEGALLLITYYI